MTEFEKKMISLKEAKLKEIKSIKSTMETIGIFHNSIYWITSD